MRNVLLLLAGLLSAQGQAPVPCSDESARQKAGAWSSADDTLTTDRALAPAVTAAALRNADEVVGLLKRAIPTPTGIEARVYRSRGAQSPDEGPFKYGVTAFFLGYDCVGPTAGNRELRGTIQLAGETSTWIYVQFNDLSQLISPLGSAFRAADGSAMFSLPPRSGDFKGRPRYTWESGGGVRWEAILVRPGEARLTRDVTREDFLRAREQIERDQLALLRSSAGARGGRAGNDQTIRSYEQRLAKLEAQREAMRPAERQEPAVIKNAHAGNRDNMTFAAKGEPGERLFTLSPELIDKSLPRQTIQFAVILLRWQPASPAKVEVMRQFRERFDIDALRALFGKR